MPVDSRETLSDCQDRSYSVPFCDDSESVGHTTLVDSFELRVSDRARGPCIREAIRAVCRQLASTKERLTAKLPTRGWP